MKKRYKIPIVILGIIVGLPLLFIVSIQIDNILKQPSIPGESFSLFSVPQSEHLELLTSKSWRSPPTISLGPFDDHTIYSYLEDGTFVVQGVSDYTISPFLGNYRLFPLSDTSGLIFTVNQNKIPRVVPYEIRGENSLIIEFRSLGGLDKIHKPSGDPPIQFLDLLEEKNIADTFPIWFGITNRTWTIVNPEQENYSGLKPSEIEFSSNGTYLIKYSDGCQFEGLFGITENLPKSSMHMWTPHEYCHPNSKGPAVRAMSIVLVENKLCLGKVEYSLDSEKTESIQCNTIIDILNGFDNRGAVPQLVVSLQDAYVSKNSEICKNLPASEKPETYNDKWMPYPTTSDWQIYCNALIQEDPFMCNSITDGVYFDLRGSCLKQLEKILIQKENSYKRCYEHFGSFYTSSDEVRNCLYKFDLTNAPEFYQKLNACMKKSDGPSSGMGSERGKCLLELAIDSGEEKLCNMIGIPYSTYTYSDPNCRSLLNGEIPEIGRPNSKYGIQVQPGETKEITLHCNPDEYATTARVEVAYGDLKLMESKLVIHDPEKIRGESWQGKTTLEAGAVNNGNKTGAFYAIVACKKISSESIEKQISLGIPEDEIQCNPYSELIFNATDGSPVCVMPKIGENPLVP